MDDQGVKELAALARAERFDIGEVIDPRTGGKAVIGRKRSSDGAQHFEDITSKLDPFLTAPLRRTGSAKVLTLDALIALANRHKDADSVLFASVQPAQIVAVIDYHLAVNFAGGKPDAPHKTASAAIEGVARFGKHRVVYDFPVSPQMRAWQGANGRALSQADFAMFIEDNVADLASPNDDERKAEKLFQTKFGTPAELMQLSRGLAVRVDATVKEAVIVQSGETEMVFTEEHRPASGNGKFTVPGLFVTAFPLFEGEAPSRAIARLRYRIKEGKVSWSFAFYRFDDVLRAKVLESVNKAAAATALPSYLGAPEA